MEYLKKNREKILIFTNKDKNGNTLFNDIVPLFLGYEHCAPAKSFGPYIRNYYIIHVILKGEGVFKTKKGEFHLSSGNAFIIKPNEITTYVADSKNPWSYAWIAFNGSYARKLDDISPVQNVSTAFFNELKELYDSDENFTAEKCVSLLFNMFSNFNKNINKNFVDKIKNYIENNYMQDIKIENLTYIIGYDRRYLSRVFKEKTNLSIKEYLTEIRLKNAEIFLRDGYCVKDTALLCGYKDPFAFSKAFKLKFGLSPTKFLEKNK